MNSGFKFHGGHGGHCRRAPLIGRDAFSERKIITAKVSVPYFPHWPLSSDKKMYKLQAIFTSYKMACMPLLSNLGIALVPKHMASVPLKMRFLGPKWLCPKNNEI